VIEPPVHVNVGTAAGVEGAAVGLEVSIAAGVAVGADVGASVGAAVGVAAAELQAPTTIAAAMIMAPKRRVPLSNLVSPLPL
jgi:hypothetical protein